MEPLSAAKILTINQVAEILRCFESSRLSNVLNGKMRRLPHFFHYFMGRRKLVRREWLDAWLEEYKCQHCDTVGNAGGWQPKAEAKAV